VLQEVDKKGRFRHKDDESTISFGDNMSTTTSVRELREMGFPDDGYDYSQHMRVIGNGAGGAVFIPAAYEEDEMEILDVPADVRGIDDSKVHVDRLRADEEDMDEDGFAEDDEVIEMDAEEIADEDVARLLEGEIAGEDELEDDFILKATADDGTAALGSSSKDNKGKGHVSSGRRVVRFDADDDEDADDEDYDPDNDEDEDFDDEYEYDYDEEYDDDPFADADEDDDGARVHGISRPSFRRGDDEEPADMEALEQQFDAVLAEYDDDEIGELDVEDERVRGALETEQFDHIFDEYLKNDKKKSLSSILNTIEDPEERRRKKELILAIAAMHAQQEEDGVQELEILEEKKKSEWDCETIVSTYSNLDNHPVKIEGRKKQIKLSQKTGIPKGYVHGQDQNDDAMAASSDQDDEDSEDGQVSSAEPRKKGETAEERRERKKRVKEEKRVQRERKKNLKATFRKEEQRQQHILAANPSVRTVPL
jgi:protein LTV1